MSHMLSNKKHPLVTQMHKANK